MCTNNPTEGGKPSHTDTKAELIFKRVFYSYQSVVGTNVGCGLVKTLFLSLTLFPVPLQDVGHGPVRILFLSLILFLVPDPNGILLCWASAN